MDVVVTSAIRVLTVSTMRLGSPMPLEISRLSSSICLSRMLSIPFPSGTCAFKEVFGRHIQDLHIRGEHLARFDITSEHDGLNAVLTAQLEAQITVNDLDISFPHLFEQVVHSFPGDDTDISRLLKARDEQVGDGLLQVVIGPFAGLVFEGDDSYRVFNRFFLWKEQKNDCG